MALLGNKPSRGVSVSKPSARNCAPLVAVSSLLFCVALSSCCWTLAMKQLFASRLCKMVLSDQEEKVAANQKVLEMGDQLVALIVFG